MILTQLVTGLAYPELQDKVMVMGDKLSLEKAVSQLEGLELGKSSRATSKPGAVEEVSAEVKTDHQKVKVASKLGTVGQPIDRQISLYTSLTSAVAVKSIQVAFKRGGRSAQHLMSIVKSVAKLVTLVVAL